MTGEQKYINLLTAIAEYMPLKDKWDKYRCLSDKEKSTMYNRKKQIEHIIQADKELIVKKEVSNKP